MRFAVIVAVLVVVLAAPARAEVRLIDVATGAMTGPVHDESLLGWTEAGLFVTDGSRVWRVADGTATLQPQYEGAVSIGPRGHAVFADFGAFELRDAAGKTITRRRSRSVSMGPRCHGARNGSRSSPVTGCTSSSSPRVRSCASATTSTA